jgi:phenylacetic acid degradation operon negative regulatory protein
VLPFRAGDGLPERAWDLDGLRARYDEFTAYAEELRGRAHAGRISPVEALVARTRIMDEWRAFPGLDPDLPGELLPQAWPRSAAARCPRRCSRPGSAPR